MGKQLFEVYKMLIKKIINKCCGCELKDIPEYVKRKIICSDDFKPIFGDKEHLGYVYDHNEYKNLYDYVSRLYFETNAVHELLIEEYGYIPCMEQLTLDVYHTHWKYVNAHNCDFNF